MCGQQLFMSVKSYVRAKNIGLWVLVKRSMNICHFANDSSASLSVILISRCPFCSIHPFIWKFESLRLTVSCVVPKYDARSFLLIGKTTFVESLFPLKYNKYPAILS